MPDYWVYHRPKNSKKPRILFNGEPISAKSHKEAMVLALKMDRGLNSGKTALRHSRLYAKAVPPKIEANIVNKELKGLSPEEMKAVLTKDG